MTSSIIAKEYNFTCWNSKELKSLYLNGEQEYIIFAKSTQYGPKSVSHSKTVENKSFTERETKGITNEKKKKKKTVQKEI